MLNIELLTKKNRNFNWIFDYEKIKYNDIIMI